MRDIDMREPLFDFLEQFYGKIRIFEEKVTGKSRADVIGVIDGGFIGFEIKSDQDSYVRLKTQTKDYDRLCDVNYLVVGAAHRRHGGEHVPGHWGVLCIYEDENGIHVEVDQVPALNPGARLSCQLSFLWRPELAMLQEKNHLPRYAQESKAFVQKKLLERVEPLVLKRQITDTLFERDYDALLASIDEVRKKRALAGGKRPVRKRVVRRKRKGQRNKEAKEKEGRLHDLYSDDESIS